MTYNGKFLTILSSGIQSLVSALTNSSGATDANKLIATDSTGKIDSSLLPSMNVDPTVAISASLGCRIFEEFISGLGTWTVFNNGTGASATVLTPGTVVDTGGHPGVCYINTGTTATGYARLGGASGDNLNRLLLGFASWQFECSFQLLNLRTSTEEFFAVFGFSDTTTQSFVDAVTFLYNSTSTNWLCVTSSNSTQTVVDSGVPVSTNWIKLKIKINGAANSVDFYINDSLVATITTNIPKGTLRQTCPHIGIFKSVGTTNRYIILDYTDLIGIFNTPR